MLGSLTRLADGTTLSARSEFTCPSVYFSFLALDCLPDIAVSCAATSKRMVLWVFGYGSLLWRAGFDYDHKLVGFIKGYKRVFHQGNTDHRGTPEQPGRTVTLEQDPHSTCWGVAYCVSGQAKEDIALSYLELREKEYDLRVHLDLYTDVLSSEPTISGVLVYLASTDKTRNQFYLGEAPLKDMAWQIARAVGPSGANAEYLFKLHKCLQEIGCEEDELENLVSEVQKLMV